MKNIFLGLATAALLFLGSCEDYLDVNKNPNEATVASPALVLPAVLQGVATRVTVDVNLDFPTWMGYWSHADGWSGWFDIKQYLITTNNWQTFFNTPYQDFLMDIAFIEKNSTAALDANYVAVAKILKGMVYQTLVDAYGDVPYTQACQGIAAPVYDDGKSVYDSILANLDMAIAIIDANPNANAPSGDFMFDGDMDQWKRLANTLKLKLLLRQVNVSGFTPPAAATLEAMDFLEADAEFNPGYGATNMQPYYASFGWSSSGALTNRRTQYVMNAFIESIYDDLNDPRKFACFDPSISHDTYDGKPFGFEGSGDDNPYNKDNGNLIGSGLVAIGVEDEGGTADKAALVFSAFESYFLQAEAVQRGWMAGDAKALYESAIEANFAFLGIADTTAEDYYTQNLEEVNWDLATDKLALILNQKYIAFCGINGFEAWCEYRRTGIPDPKANDPDDSMLSYYPGVGGENRQVPHVLYYPQREFNLNNVNAAAAAKNNYGGTAQDARYHWDARIFWDVTAK